MYIIIWVLIMFIGIEIIHPNGYTELMRKYHIKSQPFRFFHPFFFENVLFREE